MRTLIWILFGVSLVGSLSLPAAPSQAALEKSAPPAGNRYLFVVENSGSMQVRDDALRQTLFDLINTGVRGRMHPGDTFGLWTFNTTVDTRFPMQVWQPTNRLDLGTRANTFLRNQGYGKRSKLDQLMIDLESISRSVDELTVVMLVDGQDRIKGTPFDQEINAMFREMSPESARANSPVVLALQTKGGRYVAYSVVAPGDRLLLPPPPARTISSPQPVSRRPSMALAGQPGVPSIATNPPPRKVAPIIMSRDGLDPERRPSEVAGGSTSRLEPGAPAQPAQSAARPVSDSVDPHPASVPVRFVGGDPSSSSPPTLSPPQIPQVAGSSQPSRKPVSAPGLTNVLRVVKTTVPVEAAPAPVVPPPVAPQVDPALAAYTEPGPQTVAATPEAPIPPQTRFPVVTPPAISTPSVVASAVALQSAQPGVREAVPPSFPILTSPIPVQARERFPAVATPVDAPIPRSVFPLAMAGGLLVAALWGAWTWYQRSRNGGKGSFISRALPASGPRSRPRRPPTQP